MSGFWFGLQVAIVGMVLVLGVLITLSVLTSFLSRMSDTKVKSRESLQDFAAVQDDSDKLEEYLESSINAVHYDEEEGETDPLMLAVISAAVAQCFGEATTRYRITAVRRGPRESAPVWNQVGRIEQVNSLID